MFTPEFLNSALLNNLRQFLIQRRFIKRLPNPPGKPPLIPPARSKRYTIIHVPWQRAADVQELVWRRHAYNDAVATYRAMYKRMNEEQMKGAQGQEAIQRREHEEFQAVLRHNEEENRRIAAKRNAVINEEKRRLEEATLNEIDALIKTEQQDIRDREAQVLAAIERSKNFMTMENMDKLILEALENPKEYNYALDVNANVYQGDISLKYLTEPPLASIPVSEITAPLRKIGKLEEGTGKIMRAEDVAASSVRN